MLLTVSTLKAGWFAQLLRIVAIGAGDLWFDSWAGQIGHSVANSPAPAQRHLFGAMLLAQALSRGFQPRHSLHASA